MPIPLREENEAAVDVFMIAVNQVRYSAMGKPMGIDVNTIIELVKLKQCTEPIETVKKVLKLSREFVIEGSK